MRVELWRYPQAQSQRHHTSFTGWEWGFDRHKAKDITPSFTGWEWHRKRKHSTIFLQRMRKGHCQSNQHWNRSTGNFWEISGIWVRTSFPECIHTILNCSELNVGVPRYQSKKSTHSEDSHSSAKLQKLCHVSEIYTSHTKHTLLYLFHGCNNHAPLTTVDQSLETICSLWFWHACDLEIRSVS